MATQGERRAQTRRALLDAAAVLFAERGVDGASIDAIAAAADRTSGAIYDHFGGKEGLLFALLEGWVDDVAAVIGAELTTATSLDAQLAAVWRNVSDPVTGDGRWIALEHELWTYAARNPHARAHLSARYEAAWAGIESAGVGRRRGRRPGHGSGPHRPAAGPRDDATGQPRRSTRRAGGGGPPGRRRPLRTKEVHL